MTDGAPAEITMLFTDIEGSTRLLNRLGAVYAEVLSDHRRILRDVFHRWGGREVGTEGDSFFVVFDTAEAAVATAAEGQLGLQRHAWPQGVRLRVRMGLHTGRADELEDDLVGLDVHLAARISATAHGGQVVMSDRTADRVADRLPQGATLEPLGLHRLKDIPEPQRLCQLVVPGLEAEFPPLRSLGGPGGLPTAPTPLVGREGDVAALTAMLRADGPRLVTLTGPGGTGKTRLALAVARESASAHPDGVHFADLSAATDDAGAWTRLAEALGRAGEPEADFLERFRERRVLLVLDNLEQLPDSGAALVTRVLAGTERLRLLATSRRTLHVAGEQVYPVGPLGLPPTGPGAISPAGAESADAVRMFVQQARLSDPAFALTDANVADVVALCRRLDGLPLALELAAAQVRLLPPRLLLEHVEEATGIPVPGRPGRQRSLVATVTWSYGMVGEEEQRAFRALAAFGASGATLDALADVLAVPSALATVAGLLDAALVRVDDGSRGPRVTTLNTVRSVARDLLARAGEADPVRERHARYYLALAERTAPRVKGPDAAAARGLLELEMDNLRAALDWSLGVGAPASRAGAPGRGAGEGDAVDEGRAELGIRMCAALGRYWYLTGYDTESREWLERASRAASPGQGPQLARMLYSFGLLELQRGALTTARDVLAKARVLWRRAGDRGEEAATLNSLGVTYRALGEPDRARELLRESIETSRSLGNRSRQATALGNLALLEIDSGNPEEAISLLGRAERIDTALGDAWGVAADRANRAAALLAADRAEDAVPLLRDLAGSVADHGDPDLTIGVVELAAVAASQTGRHELAVRLAAAAAEQRAAAGLALAAPDVEFLDRRLTASRAAVGEGVPRLEEEGRALDAARALAEVVERLGSAAPSAEPG